MKVGYPSMGNYTRLLSELNPDLGWELITPKTVPLRTIEQASQYLNEMMCFPAKFTLGCFIECCKQGAEHLIMFDSCGLCRLKTYWILQQRALRKMGFKATVHPVRLGLHTPGDIQAINPSIPYWKAWRIFIRILRKVAILDKKLYYEILEESNLVKIGIVGEIFSVLEPEVNKHLVDKVERMGALVHNSLPLSYFVFKDLYRRGWMKRRGMDSVSLRRAEEMAHQYFPKQIGGHGNESINHTLYYALKAFDGVIHVLPFGCMPESTVAPIVDDIGHEHNMPVMRLLFDAHTGEAGVDTRLEAFVDILQRKKRAKT